MGEAIDHFMLEVGFDLPKLILISGVNSGTMSKINRGISSPTISTIKRIAKALSVKASDILIQEESFQPVLCRFFYSETQRDIKRDKIDKSTSYVYINGKWLEFTEKGSATSSSNFKDVVYLGEAPRYHTKRDGKVHCPDLYKKLCDEIKQTGATQ